MGVYLFVLTVCCSLGVILYVLIDLDLLGCGDLHLLYLFVYWFCLDLLFVLLLFRVLVCLAVGDLGLV